MSGIIAGIAVSAVAAGITAYGAVQSSEATSAANKYNASIARNNAAIATQNANYAGAAGEAQAEQASLQTRAKVGGIIANQAAGNIDVNSGSAVDVQQSEKELGQLNAMTIRSNAARQAYGYQTEGASDTAQSTLDTFSAANSGTAGTISAGGEVAGGIGSAASTYGKFVAAGGGGGNTINPISGGS